jgi:uncharacterized protein YbjT (DUF2867 family)
MPSHAVIIGATGLVGGECLRLLVEHYDTVTAVVRRSTGLKHPRLVERPMDFERLGTIEIPFGAHVYCALGTTIKKAGSEAAFRKVDQEYPRMLAGRASAAGGSRFILVSSVGANARSRNFYLRVKGELEEEIKAMRFQALHIFRPSILMGQRTEPRAAEKMGIALAKVVGPWMGGRLKKYRPIQAATVAQAMVAAANKDVTGSFLYEFDEIESLAANRLR